MPTSNKKFHAHWDAWARKENESTGQRKKAAMIMKKWMAQNDLSAAIELNALGLNSLPEHLPPGIRRINARFNRFVNIPPHLPHTVIKIDLGFNELRDLSGCPPSLRVLIAGYNNVTSIPGDLHNGLQVLVLNNNPVTFVSENLPDSIYEIDLAHDFVASRPRRGDLARLPEKLPLSLKTLCLQNNRLTGLPAILPPKLRDVNARNNFIAYLPVNLPGTLRYFNVEHNRLTSIPEDIADVLGSHAEVELQGNPLTDRVRENLAVLTNAPGYSGPTIHFSMVSVSIERPRRSMENAASVWFNTDNDAVRHQWSHFETEPGARDFAQFLDRLHESVNVSNPTFRASVTEWLSHLARRPALREQTFELSAGANATCEDRISLTLNDMKKLRLASDVENGDYDDDLYHLMYLAKGAFRLDVLERVAREKVKTLRFVDEIEVYLAYQVSLRDELDLPLDTPDMRFFNVSYVTGEDLRNAVARVKAEEAADFVSYLSTHWQPMQSVMKRLDPAGYAANRDRLLNAMDTEFKHELTSQLEAVGLNNDDDATCTLGKQISTDIAQRINREYLLAFIQRTEWREQAVNLR